MNWEEIRNLICYSNNQNNNNHNIQKITGTFMTINIQRLITTIFQQLPYSLKISRIKNFEVFEALCSTSKISSSEYLDWVTRVRSELPHVHVRNLLRQP